jgi:maltoporin
VRRQPFAASLLVSVAACAIASSAHAQQQQQPAPATAPSVPPKPIPEPHPSQPADAPPPKQEGVLSSDSSAPSVPGATTPVIGRGNEPARTVTEKPDAHEGRFEFGSYGRIYAASDLRGGTGRGTNVVAFGPRLGGDEGSYAELEMRREDKWEANVRSRIVTTVALFPPFFHFTGVPANAIAVRNLYAQGTYDSVTMWAGSRMYRGDDIHLLNWWPLDNQNTIGGGVGAPVWKSDGIASRYETVVQAHAGMQRLDNPYQFQQIPVVAPFGFGSVNVTKLDRPRTIETLKVTQFVRPTTGPSGFKVILYGELHQIAAGTYRDTLTNQDKGLPDDSGWLAGSQLTYWTGQRDTYGSLVLRHSRGIAAYDPLAVPITFALDRTTSGASETQLALSGNWESDVLGVAGAAYMRFFRDGSPTSTQKYDEGAIVARPSLFLGDHFGFSVEGSYQQRRIAIVDVDGNGPINASVTKLALMPYFSPAGKGTFKRPQIRLLYVASFRNSGARKLYPAEDTASQRGTEHFLGVGAEWWFNSSSYP